MLERILSYLTLLLCLVLAGIILLSPLYFPLREISVAAPLRNFDANSLAKLLLPYAHQGFFSVNLFKLRDNLLNEPWVASAEVVRVWPDGIQIQINEKIPLARWGQNGLLTQDGSIVPETPIKPRYQNLPLINSVADPSHVNELLSEVETELKPVQLTITELQLDAQDNLTLILSNQMQLNVGSQKQTERLTKFVNIYPKLFANNTTKPKVVDLRYNNGLAVQ